MALPVLDGNQSATTLSSVVTGGEHIVAHTVVSLGSTAISNITSAISGSVVSISNFPSTQTIAGTVTAKIDGIDPTIVGNGGSIIQPIPGPDVNSVRAVIWSVDSEGDIGAEVGPTNPLPISGTVTANLGSTNVLDVLSYYSVNYSEAFPVSLQSEISGTVTAAAPNGSLTTRFGTPTTANVSFATSAVTNANRKYLLIQNVTTGSNVITVGIGFTPTTTQGIQLTAGAGITFESSYIPTGAVQILSSVTASNFTILEA